MKPPTDPVLFVITKIIHPGTAVRTTDVLVLPKRAKEISVADENESSSEDKAISKLRKLGVESQVQAESKRQALDAAFRFIADRYKDDASAMYKVHEATFIGADEMMKRAPDLSSMQADIWIVLEIASN